MAPDALWHCDQPSRPLTWVSNNAWVDYFRARSVVRSGPAKRAKAPSAPRLGVCLSKIANCRVADSQPNMPSLRFWRHGHRSDGRPNGSCEPAALRPTDSLPALCQQQCLVQLLSLRHLRRSRGVRKELDDRDPRGRLALFPLRRRGVDLRTTPVQVVAARRLPKRRRAVPDVPTSQRSPDATS